MISSRFFIATLAATLALPAAAFDLEALKARLAEPEALAGDFDQRHWLAEPEIRLHSEGRFLYQRGRQLTWLFQTPTDSMLVFRPDDRALGEIGDDEDEDDDEDEGVEALMPLRSDFERYLVDLLGGDWDALEEAYAITLEGEEDDWRVLMTPKPPFLQLPMHTLVLDGEEWLERLELSIANGDALTIRFLEPHPPTDDTLVPPLLSWLLGLEEDDAEASEDDDIEENSGEAGDDADGEEKEDEDGEADG